MIHYSDNTMTSPGRGSFGPLLLSALLLPPGG
jgi:hypothetical protein